MADNQHYTGKAYLDKFIHPDSSQKILYPYSRGTDKRKPTGTRQLGCADDFYVQKHSGTPTNALDEARQHSETMFFASGKRNSGALAQCIYEDGFIPTSADRIMLAGAAAFVRCGSPLQIHNVAMLGMAANQQYLLNRLNTVQAKDHYRETYGDEAEKILDEHRRLVLEGKLFMDVGEEYRKELGFESFQTEPLWLEALSQMGLTIVTCHHKSFFITSDDPVILTSTSQPDNPGLLLRDAEVWFPISYRRGLLWNRKHSRVERLGLGLSQTRALNRLVVRWCYKEVYSPLPDAWIETAIKEATFDPRLGYYGSLQRMIENHKAVLATKDGKQVEIVNLLAGLRSGQEMDVLKI